MKVNNLKTGQLCYSNPSCVCFHLNCYKKNIKTPVSGLDIRQWQMGLEKRCILFLLEAFYCFIANKMEYQKMEFNRRLLLTSRVNFSDRLIIGHLGWISKRNLHHMLEICTLRPSFLHKCSLIWHHAFGLCTQLVTFFPVLGALYVSCRRPNCYEIPPWSQSILSSKF
jgi:hypothetical protein